MKATLVIESSEGLTVLAGEIDNLTFDRDYPEHTWDGDKYMPYAIPKRYTVSFTTEEPTTHVSRPVRIR